MVLSHGNGHEYEPRSTRSDEVRPGGRCVVTADQTSPFGAETIRYVFPGWLATIVVIFPILRASDVLAGTTFLSTETPLVSLAIGVLGAPALGLVLDFMELFRFGPGYHDESAEFKREILDLAKSMNLSVSTQEKERFFGRFLTVLSASLDEQTMKQILWQRARWVFAADVLVLLCIGASFVLGLIAVELLRNGLATVVLEILGLLAMISAIFIFWHKPRRLQRLVNALDYAAAKTKFGELEFRERLDAFERIDQRIGPTG